MYELRTAQMLQEVSDKVDNLMEMLNKERDSAAYEKKFYLKSAVSGFLGVCFGLLLDFILFG